MCTLIDFVPLQKRVSGGEGDGVGGGGRFSGSYEHVLSGVDVFDDGEKNLAEFYAMMKSNLVSYGYLNSILMAFEGYQYFKVNETLKWVDSSSSIH